MPAFRSVDRTSKFYSMHTFGKALHVELHPNTTSGGYFRIKTVEEGEALIGRLVEGIDALRVHTTVGEVGSQASEGDAGGSDSGTESGRVVGDSGKQRGKGKRDS